MAHKVEDKLEITKSSGNVFADIGLKNADKYLAKAELARQINHIIEKSASKQIVAAKVLGIDQPKISALSCGRLDDFSIERLINFLNKLDRDVTIARYKIKFALTRRLFEKGYSRDYVINLYKMIDWVLVLPKELAIEFKSKVHDLEEAKKVSYITSIEQLGREEGLQQGREEGLQQGRHEGILLVARKLLLEKGMSPQAVQKLTGLSEKEIMALVNKH